MTHVFHKISLFVLLIVLLSSSMIHADYKLGLQYFKQGKYIEAASEFQAEVDHAPQYDYGFYMLGLCYTMLGKYESAKENFEKAIDLAPNKFDYHIGMTQLYIKQQKFYNAMTMLNRSASLAVSPEMQFLLYYYRGLAFAGQKKHAEAIQDLRNARRIKPNQMVLEQLGKSCYQEREYDCAIEAFKEALTVDRKSFDAHYYLSKALIERAKVETDKSKKKMLYTEAVTYAETVLQLRPNNIDSFNLLAGAQFGAGNFDAAVQNFKEVIRMKPNYCWAMINLAKVLRFQSRLAEAETWLEKAIQCDPQSSIAYETLGSILLKQEKLEQALSLYQKANSLNPNPALADGIERVRTNIEIRDYNKKISEMEKLNEDELKRYEELKKKEEYWRKKQEEGE